MSNSSQQTEKVYQQLTQSFVKYSDLIIVPVIDNGETFVILPSGNESTGVVGHYQKLIDMQNSFPLIPIRKQVKQMLDQADKELQKVNPNFQLVVTYGYRSPTIQQRYFEQEKKRLLSIKLLKKKEIFEIAHQKIAVPSVAGHPTGGAVDVIIQNKSDCQQLNFGTQLYALKSEDSYTFSPFVDADATVNRMLLRHVMMSVGFAPYDGEWWHFSYGDKEWAFYYGQPTALYESRTPTQVRRLLK